MGMDLVGRHAERRLLLQAVASDRPELVAVYGRRRVGKTFLVRQVLGPRLCLELVGMHGARRDAQLANFSHALQRATGRAGRQPTTWADAFRLLEGFLEERLTDSSEPAVVFFDELPWLASRRSGFLDAFGHFWNSWASRQPRLVVVICGSAASWMLEKVVRERGGLHNRVTRRLRLEPFTLAETEQFLTARGVDLGRYQTLELYMAFGGIPFYLECTAPGMSAAQLIDAACFAREGPLRTEFEHLYAALFSRAERHTSVVRALSAKRGGMTRTELVARTGLGSGGGLTAVLDELVESGFVRRTSSFGRRKKGAVFRLSDPYSRFYLQWIEGSSDASDRAWMKIQGTPAWRSWSGLTFEDVCMGHVPQILGALGVAGVQTRVGAWRHRPSSSDAGPGAQVDLIIERADRAINLCELKFTESEFVVDATVAADLRRRREVFRRVTGTRSTLLLTLVTTYGAANTRHAQELGLRSVSMDALFAD